MLDAAPAEACRCNYIGDRALVASADTVAIVRVVATTVDDTPEGRAVGEGTMTVEVIRQIKGTLPATFVHPVRQGTACGIGRPVGHAFAGAFYESDRGWETSTCSSMSVERVEKAIEPLPPPTGRGPPAAYLSGNFAPAFGLVLDAAGRTIRYEETGTVVGTCADGEVVVRRSGTYSPWSFEDKELTVESAGGARTRHQVPVERHWSVSAVGCRGLDDVVVAVMDLHNESTKLVRLGGDAPETVASVTNLSSVVFAGDRAYALVDKAAHNSARGSRLVAIGLGDGLEEQMTDFPGGARGLDLSPDGKTAVTVVGLGAGRPGEVWTIDTSDGKVLRSDKLPDARYSGIARWVDDRRLVVVPTRADRSTVLVYDRQLDLVGSWDGWWSANPVVHNGSLYGITKKSLKAAPALTGPMTRVRTFDGREHHPFAVFPVAAASATAAGTGSSQWAGVAVGAVALGALVALGAMRRRRALR